VKRACNEDYPESAEAHTEGLLTGMRRSSRVEGDTTMGSRYDICQRVRMIAGSEYRIR
jgi:hypothetical protein